MAHSLTLSQRYALRKKLGLDVQSGRPIDTRVIGDIVDHSNKRHNSRHLNIPHDLLPRWFKYTLLVVGVSWGILFYFIQPAPFWWIR